MGCISRLRPAGAAVRLRELMLDRWQRPFAWGVRDCCMLVADAVLAATGRDPAADLRGTYSTPRQAACIVANAGGLPALLAARVGPAIDGADAIDGDVCILRPGTHEVLPGLPAAVGVLWRGAVLAQGPHALVPHAPGVGAAWWRAVP